jgi:tetratricopeptide (TPR) repeat protein
MAIKVCSSAAAEVVDRQDCDDSRSNLGGALQREKVISMQPLERGTGRQSWINPQNADAHFNLGAAHKGNGDLNAAIGAYRKAIRINPQCAAHPNLGIALEANGELEAAIAAYRGAITINPEHARTHYVLGRALMANGDIAGAKSSLESYLRLDLNNPRFSQLLLLLSQYPQAATILAVIVIVIVIAVVIAQLKLT